MQNDAGATGTAAMAGSDASKQPVFLCRQDVYRHAMLQVFTEMNKQFLEAYMHPGAPPYLLDDRDLLRRLMQRTGDGKGITVRGLAAAAGCSHATIGKLLTGNQAYVPLATAMGITTRLGVDLLVLFTPTGRTVPVPPSELALLEAVPA